MLAGAPGYAAGGAQFNFFAAGGISVAILRIMPAPDACPRGERVLYFLDLRQETEFRPARAPTLFGFPVARVVFGAGEKIGERKCPWLSAILASVFEGRARWCPFSTREKG